ncbi:ATP-binding protein, partial [Streptomyces sp. WM6386]|uniref:ATP-binding protein n=1 Tax=Streptomyces sp. WM6386 TaxID=1415558 RepID=UPI00061925EA
ELVTNAVRHTRTDRIRVSVARITTQRVRLGVIDKSRVLPHQATMRPDAIGGRGLHLVDGLADRWGTDRYRWGKRVWAELADSEQR